MDIRLKTEKYTFDGREVVLCCNMNVLADVQEAYGGDITNALNKGTTKTVLQFFAAMVNDYLDTIGDTRTYTAKEVGRLLPPYQLREISAMVMRLVGSALRKETDSEETGGEEESKNLTTTQSPTP